MSSRFELIGHFPVRWTIYWLLVPNLAIILMWPIGGPPMRPVLVLYGLAALVISQLPWRLARTVGIALLTLAAVTLYVAAMFSIPSINGRMILQFLLDVRPLRAPEYVAGALMILVMLAIGVIKAPSVPRFSKAMHLMMAILAALAFVKLDTVVTARTSDGYRGLPADGASFDSAVRQTALRPEPGRRHHVVLVIVEALGLPVAQEESRLFRAAWNRPAWRNRYDVRMGSNTYFGSTTTGELRELCGRWADYATFDFEHARCLPRQFADAGYQTSAIHSFAASMFDRDVWYPKLAFGRIEFADALFHAGIDRCEGVFPGACDSEVPRLIGRRLVEARSPQFIYWLTLNSHLPVMVEEGATGKCGLGRAEWRENFPRVCRLFQKHRELADALDRMMMDPALPPTDFLIVGDHKPPFHDRESRAHFDQSHVPWIYLRARD